MLKNLEKELRMTKDYLNVLKGIYKKEGLLAAIGHDARATKQRFHYRLDDIFDQPMYSYDNRYIVADGLEKGRDAMLYAKHRAKVELKDSLVSANRWYEHEVTKIKKMYQDKVAKSRSDYNYAISNVDNEHWNAMVNYFKETTKTSDMLDSVRGGTWLSEKGDYRNYRKYNDIMDEINDNLKRKKKRREEMINVLFRKN